MLDERKAAILRKVVTGYIETAQPIGSSQVVRDPAIDVSPATARADMAALERDGYLTHPHTSAGRIPTDKGYRFFVDNLAAPGVLAPGDQEQVRSFFARTHGELERMLSDTSRLLSQLTDYAAVVVAPDHEALTVRSVLLVRLAPRIALLVVVLSSGAVEKHTLEIPESTADADLEAANACLQAHLTGHPLVDVVSAPPTTGRVAADELVQTCFRTVAGLEGVGEEDDLVYVSGTARMAEQFAAVATVRAVLTILEQSYVVVTLLRDVLAQGQGVAIGTEHGVASLAECSLVVAPYGVGDEILGTIGVLGPTRMNYPQALAAVAVVGQRLGRRLAAG